MAKTIKDENLKLNIIVNGDQAQKELSELNTTIKSQGSRLKELRHQRDQLQKSGKANTAQYKKLSAEITKLNVSYTDNIIKHKKLILEMKNEQLTLDQLKVKFRELTIVQKGTFNTEKQKEYAAELRAIKQRMGELAGTAAAAKGTISKLASVVNRFNGLAMAAIATISSVVFGINKARQAYADYDEAIVDVTKTTDLSKSAVESLSKELAKMNTRTAQNELLGLARIAGKLGLTAVEDVGEFVSAADKINVALSKDLGDNSEDALREIGKLVDIFKLKERFGIEKSMLKVGSAINELGMASTANEGYIVGFSKRLAGIAPNADIAIENVLGLAATLDKYGQQSEMASTAIGQTIMGMFRRTAQFAKVAKMSLTEFKDLLAKDVNEALIRVLEGAKSGGGMQEIVNALDSLGLRGQRAGQVLGALSNNTSELRAQQELATKTFAEGISVITEFNRKNETAQARIDKLKKNIVALSVELGQKLTPIINLSLSTTTWLIKILNTVVNFIIKNQWYIIAMASAWAVYTAKVQFNSLVIKQNGAIHIWWKNIVAGYQLCVANAATATNIFTKAVKFLSAAIRLSPLGVFNIAITAVAAGIAIWRANTSELTKAKKILNSHMRDSHKEAAKEISELNILKGKLAGCKKGTKDYADVKKDIVDKFGKYDNTLNTETLTVETLTGKYNDLTTAIMNSANARQYDAYVAETQKMFEEKKTKKSNKLWNQILRFTGGNEELAGGYYQDFMQFAQSGEGHIDYSKVQGDPLNPKFKQHANPLFFEAFSKLDDKDRSLYENITQSSVTDITNTFNEFVELVQAEAASLKTAQKRFGINTTTTSNNEQRTPVTPEPTDDNYDEYGDDSNKEKWSLENDKAFREARLALQQTYNTAEAYNEEEYQNNLLALELEYLNKRLAALEPNSDEYLAVKEEISKKELALAKNGAKDKEELLKLQGEAAEDALAKENARYEKQQAKFKGNTEALEIVEKIHAANINKIKLEAFQKQLKDEETRYKKERAQKIRNNQIEQSNTDISYADKRRKRKKHNEELAKLDLDHLKNLAAKLRTILAAGELDGVKLTDEQILKFNNDLEETEQEIINLKKAIDSLLETSGSFIGISGKEWKDFFDSIKDGTDNWKDQLPKIASAVYGTLSNMYSQYVEYINACEDEMLARYEKNNTKKKDALKKRLDAGEMSEEQYNAECERMDEELDAKKEEIEAKQANRAKATKIADSIMNTALAVTSALATPAPACYVLAAISAAMGAAQTALIAAQPTGYALGGYDVERKQDGKHFNARLNPSKRGYINEPTILVAEEGGEYVVPSAALDNPTIAPYIDAIESVRRSGVDMRTVNMGAVYPYATATGKATGGYTTTSTADRNTADNVIMSSADLAAVVAMMKQIIDNQQKPVPAVVSTFGKGSVDEAVKTIEKLKRNSNLGGK